MADGKLYIVSTPIGHRGDLSPRAVETLSGVDLLACEDTRRTGRLLADLGIKRRLISLHEHNERRRLPRLLEELESGLSVALVSDAGTPLISDPGYPLIRAAIEQGIDVRVVPGPSAALAALTLSGLPPLPFTVLGFPPRKRGRRRGFLARFAAHDHTLVLFESPHRVLATLEDLIEVFGDRPAALARELTKIHEEVVRGPLSTVHSELSERDAIKGEMVIVVAGSTD